MAPKVSRRDFLKLLSGSFLGGILAKWFPPKHVAEAASGEKGAQPQHPLQSVKVIDSREVTGALKREMIEKAMKAPDFRNVVGKRPVNLSAEDAKVVQHTLEGGNRLWAVAASLGRRQVAVYYVVDKPLVQKVDGREIRFESEARLLQAEKEEITLLTLSVNGRLAQPKKSIGPKSGDPCGGCVDIVWGPWEYQSWVCYSYDLGCMGRCCGGCMVPCFSGNESGCLICVGIWCPLCSFSCCRSGGMGCISCGGAP